jgi:preprotein translocase subunit SecE
MSDIRAMLIVTLVILALVFIADQITRRLTQ